MKATAIPQTETTAGPTRDDQPAGRATRKDSTLHPGNWLEPKNPPVAPVRPLQDPPRVNPTPRPPPSRRRGFTMPASDAAIWDDEPPGTRRPTGP